MITIALGIILAIFAIEIIGRVLAAVVGVLQVVFDGIMDWSDGVGKAPMVPPDASNQDLGVSRAERAAYMANNRASIDAQARRS